MFKIGEKVVCIKPIDGLNKNEIYTISYISPRGGLILKEDVAIKIGYALFHGWRFRKLDYDFVKQVCNMIEEDNLVKVDKQ